LPEQDEDKVSGGFVSTALQWLTYLMVTVVIFGECQFTFAVRVLT